MIIIMIQIAVVSYDNSLFEYNWTACLQMELKFVRFQPEYSSFRTIWLDVFILV